MAKRRAVIDLCAIFEVVRSKARSPQITLTLAVLSTAERTAAGSV